MRKSRLISMLFKQTGLLLLVLAIVSSCKEDDPVPVILKADFAESSINVSEDAGVASTVTINFGGPTANVATLTVSVANALGVEYETHYVTNPNGSSGTINLEVAKGASSATFTVTPVDNMDKDVAKVITFTLSAATGSLELGTATTLTFTINNDDNITTKTIAGIRALYSGTDVDITDEWQILGLVTSTNEALTSRNLFIEDETGGILVRWSETHTFARGDEVAVLLTGSTLSDFNDLVQVTGTMPLTNGTVNSSGNTLTPTTISLTDLNSDAYQGQLVTVTGVTFTDADGLNTFSGNNTINDGAVDADVRVEFFAPFSGDALPLGSGDVTGVVGIFSGSNQLLPQERTDVFANNPSAVITVTGTLTDFGTVDTDMSSASQNYTVSGTGLTADIVVTAPNQFEVSLDDATFSGTVNVASADAMAGDVTVYARFSPTTGFAGTPSGDITHATAGAVVEKVAVSGTENPPGGGTSLLFADDFDYGSSTGDLTAVSSGTWSAHSGAGNNPVGYITTSLSMTNYGSSGVGGSITVADPGGSSEDVNAPYSEQTSGVLYAATLANLSSFTATGNDYFFHFKDASFGLYARVYVKDDGAGNLLFGIKEGSGTSGGGAASIVYSSTNFSYNTTYLIVIKYDFTVGAASLYVLDNAAATEPGTPTATIDDADNATTLSTIAFRQGSNTPNANIDGVRVATDWAGVIGN